MDNDNNINFAVKSMSIREFANKAGKKTATIMKYLIDLHYFSAKRLAPTRSAPNNWFIKNEETGNWDLRVMAIRELQKEFPFKKRLITRHRRTKKEIEAEREKLGIKKSGKNPSKDVKIKINDKKKDVDLKHNNAYNYDIPNSKNVLNKESTSKGLKSKPIVNKDRKLTIKDISYPIKNPRIQKKLNDFLNESITSLDGVTSDQHKLALVKTLVKNEKELEKYLDETFKFNEDNKRREKFERKHKVKNYSEEINNSFDFIEENKEQLENNHWTINESNGNKVCMKFNGNIKDNFVLTLRPSADGFEIIVFDIAQNRIIDRLSFTNLNEALSYEYIVEQ